VRAHQGAHPAGRADPGAVPERVAGGAPDRALAPRAAGRDRVPRRAPGRRDPDGGAHRRGGGRVRRHDDHPRLPPAPPAGRGAGRAPALRADPVRPPGGGGLPHRVRRSLDPSPPGVTPAMSATLMISVSGMRGLVGTDLTPELVARHAAALGAWAKAAGRPRVVLGRDARTSGPMFARAAAAGLMSVGVEVIDVGLAPTPTVQLAVEHHGAGAGLVLTASHNPIEWNALKRVGPDGVFLDAEAGAAVRALAEAGPPRAGWNGLGRLLEDPGAVTRHLDAVLALPVIDVAAIRGRKFHV